MSSTSNFSGKDVMKVLCNKGGFKQIRTTGSHHILEWTPPEKHENSERRVVAVPFQKEMHKDTLQEIADNAGAKKFHNFLEWIRRNK